LVDDLCYAFFADTGISMSAGGLSASMEARRPERAARARRSKAMEIKTVSDVPPDEHRLIVGKLGPAPGASLRAMVGYGLSEKEIGRYFGVTPSSVRRLKRTLDIDEMVA